MLLTNLPPDCLGINRTAIFVPPFDVMILIFPNNDAYAVAATPNAHANTASNENDRYGSGMVIGHMDPDVNHCTPIRRRIPTRQRTTGGKILVTENSIAKISDSEISVSLEDNICEIVISPFFVEILVASPLHFTGSSANCV